jgi:glycerol-3-phosphate dehydrogenase
MLIIFVNKGIESNTLLLPHEVVQEVLGPVMAAQAVFLSGPSFASEVVGRQPVINARSLALSKESVAEKFPRRA